MVIWATLPVENITTTPDGSLFMMSVACSPESKPGIQPWMPECFCLEKAKVAALDMVSQYMIFPVYGMTTINPGTPPATVDKSNPRGAVLPGSLQDSGIARVKTSAGEGDGTVVEYAQTMACDLVKAKAYP